MIFFNSIAFVAILIFSTGTEAAKPVETLNKSSQVEIKQQARDFFHDYINSYNRRFKHPAKKEAFINDLSALVNMPFMMSPSNSTTLPRIFNTLDEFSPFFERFVQNLESKGAVSLQWQEINLHVLSENRILANNVGLALNAEGEKVYETISLYLIQRINNQWKIVLFSPYDFANRLQFSQSQADR